MVLQKTDIAIIGGGLVGGALSIALAQQGFTVTVIEYTTPRTFNASAQPDIRISAIGANSIDFLHKLGIWDLVLGMRAHPYRRLETWEWESANVTFDASELKLAQLGFMVENNVLHQAIWHILEDHPNITSYISTSLIELQRDKKGCHLTLNDGRKLSVSLLIGADGANSQVRQMVNISSIDTWQYSQSCMVITVQCEKKPGNITWQHFTPNGPHAFLPLFDHWGSLIWYDKPSRIRQLKNLSMIQLEHEIIKNFPKRLGKVIPIATSEFLLRRHHALQYVCTGVALVGDAAHSIHPLAGQGVNLGYRDIDALVKIISCARFNGEDWASQEILLRYQHRRMLDNFIMQLVMDILHVGFTNDLWAIRLIRNIGLIAAEHSGIFKRTVLKYALGFYDVHHIVHTMLLKHSMIKKDRKI